MSWRCEELENHSNHGIGPFLREYSNPNNNPDSKVHGTNMGPTWGRQDPGGPHVGPMNPAIWENGFKRFLSVFNVYKCSLAYTHFAPRLILNFHSVHDFKWSVSVNAMKIGYLISILSLLNHARRLMAYIANNYHVFKSDILPKWTNNIFYSEFAMFV